MQQAAALSATLTRLEVSVSDPGGRNAPLQASVKVLPSPLRSSSFTFFF